MDAIERFEVSFRTHWAYELSLAYGAHAHLNKSLFKQKQYIGNKRCGWNYDDNVNRLKKSVANSSEIFIQHFKKYDEELPPIWAICEIMTFGELSTWYSNLRHGKDRNAIARAYKLDEVNLTSFLHHLSIVRNLCAHHARLWNRDFTVVWKLPLKTPSGMIENFNSIAKRKIYNTLVMLAYLTDTINPNNSWKKRLFALFMKYENVKESYMGFPDNWRNKQIWQ